MIAFWSASALLAAVALALVLRPLLGRAAAKKGPSREALNLSVHREQLRELEAGRSAGTLAPADYERGRREIEQRVLEEDVGAPEQPKASAGRTRYWRAGAALAMALVSIATYYAVGNPAALNPEARSARAPEVTPEQVQAMVARLAERLKEKPDDPAGWKLLGRAYSVMGRYAESAQAYARASRLEPRDAQLLADFADALAMSRGQTLAGEPEQLVLRALEIEPGNLKALALAGSAAFERRDYARAATYWERMLRFVPEGSEDARSIQANVDEAKALAVAVPLKGTVRLSKELQEKAAPEDTVFIYARAAEGPPMPLAVLRKKVRDLPLEFSLDDAMAMTPGMKLSAYPRVIVGARVSKSGNATPQPGDLQGSSPPVANDASGVLVTIDQVR